MNTNRNAILARIAQANRRRPGDEPPAAVLQRLQQPPKPPAPRWQQSHQARFLERLQEASATVDQATDLTAAAADLTAYLGREGLDNPVLAPHALLRRMAVQGGREGPIGAEDPVAVTVAYAGVAETGSLVLLSGRDTPTSLNFLPDHLVCILESRLVVPDLESLWQRIRSEYGMLPRTINLVTGPSRTADVEQTIQLGAHGPRKLHLILLEATP